jgi:uncharacterized protein YfdQ (DUF2303 family)
MENYMNNKFRQAQPELSDFIRNLADKIDHMEANSEENPALTIQEQNYLKGGSIIYARD